MDSLALIIEDTKNHADILCDILSNSDYPWKIKKYEGSFVYEDVSSWLKDCLREASPNAPIVLHLDLLWYREGVTPSKEELRNRYMELLIAQKQDTPHIFAAKEPLPQGLRLALEYSRKKENLSIVAISKFGSSSIRLLAMQANIRQTIQKMPMIEEYCFAHPKLLEQFHVQDHKRLKTEQEKTYRRILEDLYTRRMASRLSDFRCALESVGAVSIGESVPGGIQIDFEAVKSDDRLLNLLNSVRYMQGHLTDSGKKLDLDSRCLSDHLHPFWAMVHKEQRIKQDSTKSYFPSDATKTLIEVGPNGESPYLQRLIEKEGLKLVAESMVRMQSPPPIVLIGSTGSGKLVLAKAIHRLSRRPGKFGIFNFQTTKGRGPDHSQIELFGVEGGLYNGVHRTKDGLIKKIGKGTLLLDDFAMEGMKDEQINLLQTILDDSPWFTRLGGTERMTPQCQFIFATKHNLDDLVVKGHLIEDLRNRLNGPVIFVEPLWSRQYDIPVLSQHFLSELLNPGNFPCPCQLSNSALQALKDYEWPGNVRELRRMIQVLTMKLPKNFNGVISREEVIDAFKFMGVNTLAENDKCLSDTGKSLGSRWNASNDFRQFSDYRELIEYTKKMTFYIVQEEARKARVINDVHRGLGVTRDKARSLLEENAAAGDKYSIKLLANRSPIRRKRKR